MARCLELAKIGLGTVAPNPLVGSIIVHENKIIGEGYHQEYGKAHAEVNAIISVKDQSLLRESTLYVNLEPCAHFGKTPPCANLIIEKKIKRVVIGCIDPFAEVSGKGIEKLKAAGIEVVIDVLNAECLHINRRFFTFHKHQRPYVILKWAQSTDGFMDIDRIEKQKGVFWITQPETKSLVHKWRTEEAAILVGRKTVENDDPQLTSRAFKGSNPTRFVIDKNAKLKLKDYRISQDHTPTFVLCEKENKTIDNVKWIPITPFSIHAILKKLYDLNIQSVIIEGGKKTIESFIVENIWDEARILTGINTIKKGIKAPIIEKSITTSEFNFGEDKVSIILH